MNNQEDLLKFYDEFFGAIRAKMIEKNTDYTGKKVTSDPFANFSAAENLGFVEAERYMAARIVEKLQRLASYFENGTLAVKEEPVDEVTRDIACLAFLISAKQRSRKSTHE